MSTDNETKTKTPIARYIDHTLLKPTATVDQMKQLCQEAADHQFASVCVHPCHVQLCAALFKKENDDKDDDDDDESSAVAVGTVIGFPLGANTTAVKVYETQQAIRNGATEVDMVVNMGAIKDGHWDAVETDIKAVVQAAHTVGEELDKDVLVKVILETCYLTDNEKVQACRACCAAGADFVKTSTGFGSGGATVDDVKLLRANTHASMGVKASGGIRTYADTQAMMAAGATRIGTSGGVTIVRQAAEAAAAAAAASDDDGPNTKKQKVDHQETSPDPTINACSQY